MNLERPYLLLTFAVLLFIGVSNLWDHKLQHDFPYGYLASDAFQQQTRAEGIKDAGNYRHEPFYIVKGYRDVIGYYPPVFHHLGVMLHFLTGIPVYDTAYFIVFFTGIIAAFAMYVVIRRYNKQIAVLALPLSILMFSSKSYIGFLWGQWASITGQLFLICVFWSMSRIEIEKIEILLGIFIAALAMSHTSELIYGVLFIFIYIVLLFFYKKLTLKFFLRIVVAGVISGVLSFYTIFIFARSFMVINPYTFDVSTDWGGTPIVYLTDFRLLLLFLAVGLAASIFLFRKFDVPVLAGLFMLGIGYTNYIGFGIRAFQPRLLWPVYLSFFFGFGLYFLFRYVPQKIRTISVFGISILFLLILSNIIPLPNVPTYSKISTPGLMDVYHWEAFGWLGKNTPENAKLYFFYGDVYNQDAILRNSKRVHVQVVPQDYIASLQNKTIKRVYETETPADHGAGMPYFKSFLKIGLHQQEDTSSLLWQDHIDLCLFDYFIFDKASRTQVLAQYNLLIANEMLKKGAEIKFENNLVVIIKNSNVGGDCIEERSF